MPDTKTVNFRICQEGHANALALNKECNQIAVAGRSLLKVFSIENDGFTEVCNMRGGKNQNLSYSSNDVAWSTLETNILATAATNGAVSVWDLSRFGRQKQLKTYMEHERTAHTVNFHGTESSLLISGSQDGTIKTFDIRQEKSINTYYSNSIRDVKFSPHPHIFSAVSENGTVQLWDLRRGDKCILQFTAHSGPIYTCDWHATKNWLATGSRDKQIKVWNMDGKVACMLEHTINTIAVVGRVKWRPECTYHIASCALVVDYSIHVWDIRRPYIPFASFNDHTNVTTDIAWRGNNSNCLLSTSKDSTIFKHAFKDAVQTMYAPQGARMGHCDDITFVSKVKSTVPVTTAQIVKSNAFSPRQKLQTEIEQFHVAKSKMCKFLLMPTYIGYQEDNTPIPHKVHESFIGCAKELILHGKKLTEICEHNARISKKYGKYNSITLWNMIKLLYGSIDLNKQSFEPRSSFSNQKNAQNLRRPIQQSVQIMDNKDGDTNAEVEETDLEDNEYGIDGDGNNNSNDLPDSYVILSETQILREITFDNFELLRNGFIYVGPTDYTLALTFPDTALHTDVQAARPQFDIKATEREKSPPSNAILKVNNPPQVPSWEPHKFMADSIMLQNDFGDNQTAISILIAIGDLRKLLPIDDAFVTHFFQVYINDLHKFQLWNEACRIINFSWLRSIRELNQQSTGVHINCGECGRPLGPGWYCQKCKSLESPKCSVCNLPVRGLYAWCQGCSHGGHVNHIKDYFSSRTKCPICGHLCEYN